MKKVKVSRSAKTGKFVTKEFTEKHPSTTVTETVRKKATVSHKAR